MAHSVAVFWNASTGATTYTVYRSTQQGVRGGVVGTTASLQLTDSSVVDGTVYWYGVTASNVSGESALSTQASATIPNAPPPAQQITSFTATPSTIISGNTSTLAWTTVNATLVLLNNNPVGANSNTVVAPTTTTTYTLTATGSAPNVSQQVTVTVTQPGAPFHAPQWNTGHSIALSVVQGQVGQFSSNASDQDGDALTFGNVYDTLNAGVAVTSSGNVSVGATVTPGLYTSTYQTDIFAYADDGKAPADADQDWHARSTAAGVLMATDFSGPNDFVQPAGGSPPGTHFMFANGFNPTLLARVTKCTTDGITSGCCLQIDWPSGSNDGSPAYVVQINPATTNVTQGIGTAPIWVQFRYKVPASRLARSVDGGGGFKLWIVGGYDPGSNWQSDSLSDIDCEHVIQNTFYRGFVQLYTHDIGSNGGWNGGYVTYEQPFVSVYSPSDFRLENAVYNSAGVDQAHQLCLYSQGHGAVPPDSPNPGGFNFVPDTWITLMARIEYVTYGWLANKSYVPGDQVELNFNVYQCITANSDASFTAGNWNLLGASSTAGLRKSRQDLWAANAGDTQWTHISSQRDIPVPVDTLYINGPMGVWLTTYDTSAGSYTANTYVRYDQLIISTLPIALPVFS
jgi:hypothetical protein